MINFDGQGVISYRFKVLHLLLSFVILTEPIFFLHGLTDNMFLALSNNLMGLLVFALIRAGKENEDH